eukprot:GHVR01176402.1.p1 GENE.GHVR01176402.1~~GHVR01176402.1.p1  ORF type:complete len:536 (+),score=143.63 GHVR01176402.1:39-1610(+)
MMDRESELYYYLREDCYRKIQNICNHELKTRVDNIYVFWRGYSLFEEGSVEDAIRETEQILEDRENSIIATAALIHYYKYSQFINKDSVAGLMKRYESELETASDHAIATAGLFLALVKQFKGARAVTQRSSSTPLVHSVKGWIEFLAARDSGGLYQAKVVSSCIEKCSAAFEASFALYGGNKCIETLMGRVKVLELKRQWQSAIEAVSQIVIAFPWYHPALLEKAKLLMMIADWERVQEIATSLESIEGQELEALKLQCVEEMAFSGCMKDIIDTRVHKLLKMVCVCEPKSPLIWLNSSQLCARLCGKSNNILTMTSDLLRKGLLESGVNGVGGGVKSLFLTELAHQQILMGKYNDATQTFHSAVEYAVDNVSALTGVVMCCVCLGQYDEANEQLIFLKEITQGGGYQHKALLSYLDAVIASRHKKDDALAVSKLNDALTHHISSFKSVCGYEFFIRLDADFMLSMGEEYIRLWKETQTHTHTHTHTHTQYITIFQQYPLHLLHLLRIVCLRFRPLRSYPFR